MPHDLGDLLIVAVAWLSLIAFGLALCYAADKPSPPPAQRPTDTER